MNCPHCGKQINQQGLIALREFGWDIPGKRLQFMAGDEFNPEKLGIPPTAVNSKMRVRLVGFGTIKRTHEEVVGYSESLIDQKVAMGVLESVQKRVDRAASGDPLFPDDTPEGLQPELNAALEKCKAVGCDVSFWEQEDEPEESPKEAPAAAPETDSIAETEEEPEQVPENDSEAISGPYDLSEITEQEIRAMKKAELVQLAEQINEEFAEELDTGLNKEPLLEVCLDSLFD